MPGDSGKDLTLFLSAFILAILTELTVIGPFTKIVWECDSGEVLDAYGQSAYRERGQLKSALPQFLD